MLLCERLCSILPWAGIERPAVFMGSSVSVGVQSKSVSVSEALSPSVMAGVGASVPLSLSWKVASVSAIVDVDWTAERGLRCAMGLRSPYRLSISVKATFIERMNDVSRTRPTWVFKVDKECKLSGMPCQTHEKDRV